MTKTTAKLFMTGRSQAVRLPKEFRMPGKEVEISRQGDVVILRPIPDKRPSWDEIFAQIQALPEVEGFMEERFQEQLPLKAVEID